VQPPILSYWYFHLPNFVLAALMYTLAGRVLLGVIVAPDSSNYIWRFFCRFTDPVVAAVALVTPKATVPVVLWLCVLLLQVLLLLGALPRTG
jgi:YggT family protein